LEGLGKASIYVDSFLAVFTRAEVEEARNGNATETPLTTANHSRYKDPY
jgi:hypothetical protein